MPFSIGRLLRSCKTAHAPGAPRGASEKRLARRRRTGYPGRVGSRLAVIGGLGALVLMGHALRSALGVAELSPTGVRTAVAALGATGPMLYFGLVFFRQLLAIPAMVILAAGGLCFGALLGGTLGAAGVILSGFAKFGIARWLGRDWARARFGATFPTMDARVDRLGPAVIALSTAHPFGILAPIHWAAGLSSVSFAGFAAAILLGAPVRAFALSMLGASLAAGDQSGLWKVAGVITLAMLVPLASPAVRRRLSLQA